jgi:hypothetical protein
MDRKMASSDTSMVSRLNGKGSKGSNRSMPRAHVLLTTIHAVNHTRCAMAKVAVPAARVTAAAMRSLIDRARSCSSSSFATRWTLSGSPDSSVALATSGHRSSWAALMPARPAPSLRDPSC